VNMWVLPLRFREGDSAASLMLTGRETYDIEGMGSLQPAGEVTVRARREDGGVTSFQAIVRIDTPEELTAFRHGGILPYVVRQLAKAV
jgi:aconitate hydratase